MGADHVRRRSPQTPKSMGGYSSQHTIVPRHGCDSPAGFNRTTMRQADINRVMKAKDHLKAAVTLLRNIKWENRTYYEDVFISYSVKYIDSADMYLDDIINTQEQ